jgi:nucleoside triphosphate pyrophosphatase
MALWLGPQPLVLASKSEIRRKILAAAGLLVEVRPAAIDERAVEQAAGPASAADVARLLAGAKAKAVAATLPGRLVLGADQTLGFGDRIFSKAGDQSAAREQLLMLRGQIHALHSAIALVQDGAVLFEHVSEARLTMRPFSDAFLDRYLATIGAATLQSVGGYQLEGVGIHLFERVDGDHFTVLGLPLLPLLGFLRAQGWVDG